MARRTSACSRTKPADLSVCAAAFGRPRSFMYAASYMLAKSNLILVGPMGSGKSAVGKQLARLLGLPFYDSDAEIERRTGVDIPFIFEKEGEAGFRQREHDTLEILTAKPHLVP